MKSAERYQKLVSEMIVELSRSETLTDALVTKYDALYSILRASRWSDKYEARRVLREAYSELKSKPKKRLKLIQGGNEFLARRSRAVLTLINCEQINETQTKRGA